jgi:hypothetical protein
MSQALVPQGNYTTIRLCTDITGKIILTLENVEKKQSP